ncbi:uncharacterized protein OCT59_016543 [Rhizophagus irregularis]|uniref:ATPase domain-containing protein n=1 Tax=Rhizophagus irregularis (strain DAOM 197198w) TaxID=1432141 RepID=A0A015J462_RHIIW|nr:hypothetical protein RirG_144300 [Rhizophagus irregularis DAOM 197198w]UZO24229.1 hypothetical protein OCT59_016543 [Rhizophagus irregularis]CAG8761416.1 20460_t:CDS:2 [Rhizophagus irregularis]
MPYFFKLDLKLFDKEEREITSNSVIDLFNKIACALPNQNLWKSYNIPPPILVIDEANLLNRLSYNSVEGTILLKTFLDWLVLNTKQTSHFHVVLTSSDSFFFNWIVDYLNVLHASSYIVGDLSKKEAEEYFEKHVLPRYGCKELEGKFDHVRKITDSKFSVFESECLKLIHGLYPRNVKYADKSNKPLWTNNDFIKTMEVLVKAENQGYILEDDLINVIESNQVNSLVDYNFLYCRQNSNFAYDIINPSDKIILTAMNQPSLRAMEHYILNYI